MDQFVFMDDNTRPLRATLVDDYLEEEGIRCMAWLVMTPDLILIEHLENALERATSCQ